jgi:hypothetical protein
MEDQSAGTVTQPDAPAPPAGKAPAGTLDDVLTSLSVGGAVYQENDDYRTSPR